MFWSHRTTPDLWPHEKGGIEDFEQDLLMFWPGTDDLGFAVHMTGAWQPSECKDRVSRTLDIMPRHQPVYQWSWVINSENGAVFGIIVLEKVLCGTEHPIS